MVNTRFILFRVTQDQYERIHNLARIKGYKTLASYLRDLALNKNILFEQRFEEVYNIITNFKKNNDE